MPEKIRNLDLSFLDVPISAVVTKKRPVNVYEVLRDGWRESRVDMSLAFFLDPNERHGFGTLVVDALLRVLDGAKFVRPDGGNGERFDAQSSSGSSEWAIQTQVNYIDLLATNVEFDLAIVVENKIGHFLSNPLHEYAKYAFDEGFERVLVVVLAPEKRTAPLGFEKWLSASVTFGELADEIKADSMLLEYSLAAADLDQRRSIDLLQQFMEIRAGGTQMADLVSEQERLQQWRSVIDEHQAALDAFRKMESNMRRLLRERRVRLEPLIAEQLEVRNFAVGWEAHGGSGDDVWNAYHFPAIDWSAELKFTTLPGKPAVYTQIYPQRNYRALEIEALLDWGASDVALVEGFIQRVERLFAQHG